jgi:hypothetical protein
MHKLVVIFLLFLFVSPLAVAQTPQKIHDLKSLTDSSGTVHLFYRIYAEYEGTEYFTDNIYHYNTNTGEEELFLEDFYDTRYGFESMFYVNEYDFYENNPDKYIYIGGYDFEVGYIQRYDTLAFEGFLTFPEHLVVSGDDSSMVYVSFNSQRVKSFDGGISWPTPEQIQDENIPDSLKLNFPLTSLSPYDDSLMFGASISFYRSSDAGLSNEEIEIYPNNEKLYYDSDSAHVYALNFFISDENCMPDECEHSFYKSNFKGKSGSWKKKKTFAGEKKMYAHPDNSGELYIWDEDSIYVSKDYGESIDLFYEIDEEITGVSVEGERVFISTISSLYELENNELILLCEIPVSIEESGSEIPSTITLHQNYPNPFNPSTVIKFELSQPTSLSLKIYDVVGNLVQTLVSEETLTAGEHQYT